MQEEKTLILQAQKGDSYAFEQLIAAHQKNIFSIAYRIAGNAEDAADMTQEVLIKVFQNLGKFHGHSKFSTWLYRVATNACLDAKKKMARHTALSLEREIETEEGTLTTEPVDNAPTPDREAERKLLRQTVADAIAQLGKDHQKVLLLRDVHGFSYEEIARILRCTEGTVKSRIHRSRAQLKKILSENKELFSDFIV